MLPGVDQRLVTEQADPFPGFLTIGGTSPQQFPPSVGAEGQGGPAKTTDAAESPGSGRKRHAQGRGRVVEFHAGPVCQVGTDNGGPSPRPASFNFRKGF